MHEIEKSLMLLVQLRDEFKDILKIEIEKIPETVQKLESTITKFIAHFDDFKQLSSRAERQIADQIKEAGEILADISAVRIIEKVTEGIQAAKDELNSAVCAASQALRDKKMALTKTRYIATSSFCLGALFISFGIHYFYPRVSHYHLEPTMAKTYFVGEKLLDNWTKLTKKEQMKIRQILND
jgi:hypothetical protein